MRWNLNVKTDIFYQRHENDEQIEIIFFGLPFLHILFWFVIFISLLSLGKYTTVALSAFCLGLFTYAGLSWRVIVEIRKAMQTKGVLMMGSQLSLQNPLKIVISKS